jgi:hypothetical protein
MNIDADAPVRAEGATYVDASLQTVWDIMVAVEQWPSWNPDVKWARLTGAVEPGAEFTWKAGPGTIRSTFTEVDAPEMLAWTGTTLGIRAVHIWRLEGSESGTKVSTEESWSGVLPRILSSMMSRALQKAIDTGLDALKAAAER